MAPLYEKKIYGLEEVVEIRNMAQCEKINVFVDYNEIIVNLCNTIEKLMERSNDGEKQKK
jgi:hypothetical protein